MITKISLLKMSILIFGGLSFGHLAMRIPLPIIDVRFGSETPYNADRATGKRPSGPELVMAFIGSPNCAYSSPRVMVPLVREAAVCLRERAADLGAPLVSVGVSSNWVPGEGWRYLRQFMDFDEVVIGRNWLNSEVVELEWSFPNARVGTPQIIVFRQKVVLPSESQDGRASVTREAPTGRVIGSDEIQRWVEAGCPLEWRS